MADCDLASLAWWRELFPLLRCRRPAEYTPLVEDEPARPPSGSAVPRFGLAVAAAAALCLLLVRRARAS